MRVLFYLNGTAAILGLFLMAADVISGRWFWFIWDLFFVVVNSYYFKKHVIDHEA